jgi:hypothetical protein
MNNFRIKTLTSWNDNVSGTYYWTVKIYSNKELIKFYAGFTDKKDAEKAGQAFLDGIEFIRSKT